MDLTIHSSFLPHTEPDASLAFSLATSDGDGTFAKLEADGAEVVQEPTEQPYGVRDCAFRDPAGNMIRIQELR
jgi:uncharacterized glyoxalase superfamily protein PhnB